MQPATHRIIDEAARFILDGITRENAIASSETDSNAILILDRRAQSLRSTLKALYTSLTTRIAETERERNAYTSIHRLPLELLINVLQLVLDDTPVPKHFTEMHKMACVSHQWNDIVRRTPSMWAYIDSSFSLPLTMNAIAKSLRAPLNVTLSHMDLYGPSCEVLMEALKHVHRWGHAKLAINVNVQMRSALEMPAPLLTHIDLSTEVPIHPIDLFRGQADRLEHLQLTCVTIPFDTPMLSGLRHLELRDIYFGPSTSTLIHILVTSPNLSHLALVAVRADCDRLPDDRTPIVMPNLTYIELRKLTPGYCAALLSAIRAPECTSLHLQCDMLTSHEVEEDEDEETDHPIPSATPFSQDTLGQLVEPVKRILRQCDGLSFHLTASTLRLRHGPPPTSGPLEIDLTSVSPVDVFQWIVETFRTDLARVSTSMILAADFPICDPTFLTTLRHLERMNSIDIQGVEPTTDLNPFLDHLRYPFTCYDSDVKRWALPCLRKLNLTSEQEWSSFLPMIRSRYGKDDAIVIEGTRISVHAELPLPFEKLELPALYRNPGLMQQITAIVGEGVLGRQAYPYHPRFGGPGVWYGGSVGGVEVFVEDADGAPMAYPGNVGPIPLPLGHPAIAAHSHSFTHPW